MTDPTITLYDGATPYDITAQVQSVSFKHGRSRELDTIEAATGTIQLINYDRSFDPPNLNGDTSFGEIKPGMRVEVFDGAVQVFAGYVLDFDYSWGADRTATATIYLSDAMGILAATTFTDWQADDLDDAGTRITACLDRSEVGFPSGASYRDINPGIDPLQGDIVTAGTPVLGYLQTVARSDQGRLWVTRDGVLTYRSRHETWGTTGGLPVGEDVTGPAFISGVSATGAGGVTLDLSTFMTGNMMVVVVACFSGYLWNTPAGWTEQHNSTGEIRLQIFSKIKVAETSVALTRSGIGNGALGIAFEIAATTITVGTAGAGGPVGDAPYVVGRRLFVAVGYVNDNTFTSAFGSYPAGYIVHVTGAREGAALMYRMELGERSDNGNTGFTPTYGVTTDGRAGVGMTLL